MTLVACHLTIKFQPEDDRCYTYWNIAELCLIRYKKDTYIPYSPIHNKENWFKVLLFIVDFNIDL